MDLMGSKMDPGWIQTGRKMDPSDSPNSLSSASTDKYQQSAARPAPNIDEAYAAFVQF